MSALSTPRLTAAQPLPGAAVAGSAPSIDAAIASPVIPSAAIGARLAGSLCRLIMSIAPLRNYRDSTPLLQSKTDRSMDARPIGQLPCGTCMADAAGGSCAIMVAAISRAPCTTTLAP